ncbi:glycerol channel [Elasticomyces elasticus]|uniref:Glycerol channel n=1 Tax=Exophiala sideris TaxID=1016849 RepID=A0ABR0JN76_9EURO|nr:glycerol channel [Elasticomyces elasticus]KAK5037948.1 glycerol channel [Exophiala sideris]KAK5043931.1 glycerol channel [Exophiala sideris]KAK5067430.1 glycerol channel [Exophiala sideris]KAK5182763.1 glycerol channel [Eurotiomycetes sp. CCFEE 6388]
MATDQIHIVPYHQTAAKDLHSMALEKESLSSTPPTTHNESIPPLPPHNHHHEHRHTTVEGQPPFREHGPLIDHQLTKEDVVQAEPDLTWSRIRHFCREPFAEFLGVFILIMFGDGVVAQVVLSNGLKGDYQSISWGWGLGVMLGVYTAGISGAHLNPAVTFANCVFRKFPWRKFPFYMIAQILGAMCASGVVYANYKSAIDVYEGGAGIRTVPGYSTNATAGIFCTYPAEFMTKTGQFFSEFIASTLLMFLIYVLKDDGNLGAGNLTPLGLFFVIFGIGACFGWETGYAINLARDFGPRLMSYMLGYGHHVWSAGGYYFWVPMVAPFFGCTFGGFLYDVFLFTGESPINTKALGLARLLPQNWNRRTWSNTYKSEV